MKKINRFLLGRCTPQIQVQESVWGGGGILVLEMLFYVTS